MAAVYVDTSALAKWYVDEAGSEAVEEFMLREAPVFISLLTVVEMRSLLARRVTQGDFDAATQAKVLATFDGDIAAGHLVLLPHTVEAFQIAESLMGAHPELGLRTLDALHLGVMRSAGVSALATADRVMISAAEVLGLECECFV